jgi:hypothetical protein
MHAAVSPAADRPVRYRQAHRVGEQVRAKKKVLVGAVGTPESRKLHCTRSFAADSCHDVSAQFCICALPQSRSLCASLCLSVTVIRPRRPPQCLFVFSKSVEARRCWLRLPSAALGYHFFLEPFGCIRLKVRYRNPSPIAADFHRPGKWRKPRER